jgi:organic hydroperoxide reductase OsmC/OhrA
MRISAQLVNGQGLNEVTLITNGNAHTLTVPPKPTGAGSSANGGEILFLALATCYCNDIYREAKKRGIDVLKVEVSVDGEFGGEGEPARNIVYGGRVTAHATAEAIVDLMRYTDTVAEIQNTIRRGVSVQLVRTEAIPV